MASDILTELRAAGITLSVDGGNLVATPKAAITDELREARMGEMLEAIPQQRARQTSKGGSLPSLPHDIDHKTSHYAQQLARHPEAIEEAIAEAKERGDIPTRRDALGLIRRTGHGIHYSSETPEHYTPKNILDAVVSSPRDRDERRRAAAKALRPIRRPGRRAMNAHPL